MYRACFSHFLFSIIEESGFTSCNLHFQWIILFVHIFLHTSGQRAIVQHYNDHVSFLCFCTASEICFKLWLSKFIFLEFLLWGGMKQIWLEAETAEEHSKWCIFIINHMNTVVFLRLHDMYTVTLSNFHSEQTVVISLYIVILFETFLKTYIYASLFIRSQFLVLSAVLVI